MSRRRQGVLLMRYSPVAVAIDAACDGDFGEIEIDAGQGEQLRIDLGEGHADIGHADRSAAVRAVENDVGHFRAAQRLGGLLAEHPADGVRNVGLAAAVRADNGRHARQKLERRLLGKRLEADELNALQIHNRVPTPCFSRNNSRRIAERKLKIKALVGTGRYIVPRAAKLTVISGFRMKAGTVQVGGRGSDWQRSFIDDHGDGLSLIQV